MTTVERELLDLVQQLPVELRGQVRDFAQFLLQKRPSVQEPAQSYTLRQDWAGALAGLDTQVDSVALQHQASAWMTAGAWPSTDDHVSP